MGAVARLKEKGKRVFAIISIPWKSQDEYIVRLTLDGSKTTDLTPKQAKILASSLLETCRGMENV